MTQVNLCASSLSCSMNLHIDDTQIQDINELASFLEGSTLNDTANSNNQEGSSL